jgi:hypothetical protein
MSINPLVNRTLRIFADAFAAFVAGSRIVPLGDNGPLIRELALRLKDR